MLDLIQRHRERLLRELKSTEDALVDLTSTSARYKADRVRITAQLELINKMRADAETVAERAPIEGGVAPPKDSDAPRFWRALREGVRVFGATIQQQFAREQSA